MQSELLEANELIQWYKNRVRPFLAREQPAKLESFDNDCTRLKNYADLASLDLTVCFLGNSGVGKSTLINAVLGGVESVVPFGGIGPLTAQAVVVKYGSKRGFEVEYHKADRISQTVFALEQFFKSELYSSIGPLSYDQARELSTRPDETNNSEPEEGDVDRRTLFRKRAQLMVRGSQAESLPVDYLIDSLRQVMGNSRVWGTELAPEDESRIGRLRRAVELAGKGRVYSTVAAGEATVSAELRHHAAGFMAPLIKKLTVHWPAELLESGVTLVDLPGVGIDRDVHSEITREYIRHSADALVLVVDHRGLSTAVAQSLRESEFLNRLIYTSDEPHNDPVVLVAVTRIDDDADSRRAQDKTKNKAWHFADACEEARDKIRREMALSLEEVWLTHEEKTEARQRVVNNLLGTLQVHPLSAPQYRKILAEDEDDLPFVKQQEQTGIPGFVQSLTELATKRHRSASERLKEQKQLFFESLNSTLRLIGAQWEEESRAGQEAERLRVDLEDFIRPLREEFASRQGAYRNTLKNTIPKRISDLVTSAKHKSALDISRYLYKLDEVHWRTLQAAVRKEGRQYGTSSAVDLPKEFALRFEEPLADIWGTELLKYIRQETRDYAKDIESMVDRVFLWARSQGTRVQVALVEAQRDALRVEAKKLQSVGREMVKEMREQANQQLVTAIETPIKKACNDFVRDQQDSGAGVKRRILKMCSELPEKVTEAAEPPAKEILLALYKEAYKEISDSFAGQNPLDSVAQSIVSDTHEYLKRSDAQRRRKVKQDLQDVLSKQPALDAQLA